MSTIFAATLIEILYTTSLHSDQCINDFNAIKFNVRQLHKKCA